MKLKSITILLAFAASTVGCATLPDSFPPKPDFENLSGNDQRQEMFGPMKYRPKRTRKKKGSISIDARWKKDNLVVVKVPWLNGVPKHYPADHPKFDGRKFDGEVTLHKDIAYQFEAFFRILEAKNLHKGVNNYCGDHVARMVSGSRRTLSNHAFGTAIDINCHPNAWDVLPAPPPHPQSLYSWVPIAHELGIYWGGHFSKFDGMHFEAVKVLTKAEVDTVLAKYGVGV